jgi:hypothetical protein
VGLVLTLALAAALVVSVPPSTENSAVASPAFDPGFIISDGLFYDANALTQQEIQNFLDERIGPCLNSNCLNVVRADSVGRGADAMCGAFAPATQERASALIHRVQQACGISAKVLLVTLQKEQGLVTHRQPSDSRLDRAMGYACPDNTELPGWCDPRFGGLSNQIFRAAWQFKRYLNPPGTSNFFTWFPVQRTVNVRYHPEVACGGAPVRIQNSATAGLYYYTPYQPNAAALSNLRGTGDACSAYGNRNFWRFYTEWFGSTTGQVNPIGNLDGVSSDAPSSVRLRGWSLDPDSTDSLSIHVYVNGGFTSSFVANGDRRDVRAVYTRHRGNYGFDQSIAVNPGRSTVCAFAINVLFGQNAALGCQTVNVASPPVVEPAASELAPVYRFWSDVYKGHFYTRSLAERNQVIQSYPASVWRYEGAVFGAVGAPIAGTVPVYRFWSTAYNAHFYTTSEAERDQVIALYPDDVWRYELIAFYAYPTDSAAADTTLMSRFWSPTYENHFFTASQGEADFVRANFPTRIWTYEGQPFRVSSVVPIAAPLP